MDSWHSWSSDSRWLLYASKRGGIATKAYITRIDADGHASAPIELCCDAGQRVNMPTWIKKGVGPVIPPEEVSGWERRLK